jgi:hypothetical protein
MTELLRAFVHAGKHRPLAESSGLKTGRRSRNRSETG